MNIKFMKNIKTVVAVIFVFMLCLGCANSPKKKQQKTSVQPKINWTLETYAVDGGWGYFIYRNGEKMINQDQIPAILGKYPFGSEKLAEKTAKLVVKKLNSKKIPTVTKDELIELGVVDSLLQPLK